MNEFRFVVHGEPVAKGRPRLGIVRGHAMAFTPKKTRSYEQIVRETALREWNGRPLIDCALDVHATFYRAIPKSFSKSNRAAALAGRLYPTGRPDWDNLAKGFIDACNGVIYLDDKLIVSATIHKRYAEVPRAEIVITWGPTLLLSARSLSELVTISRDMLKERQEQKP